ncbi:MAG: hypothetical protein R8M45_05720 [Ghiorsea sp.]
MTALAIDQNGGHIQALTLAASGSTVTVAGGATTLPLSQGLCRLHADANLNLALGATAVATDMLIQANVDEYFYIPEKGTIATFGAGTLSYTLMP